jgi:FtsH-binding integral membrane protein
MAQQQFPTPQTGQVIYGPDVNAEAAVRTFLASVFSYMALALVISGVTAWWFGTDAKNMQILFNPVTGGPSMAGWIVMFAPLGLVFAMGGLVERLSGSVLLLTFIVFSAIMGVSFSYIFVIYPLTAIANVFFITAVVFGIMAFAGFSTKTDLTKLGSLLFIGLIGIIIGSLANTFIFNSGTMDYMLTIIGVVVFTGLTAYHVQRLKIMGETVANGTEGAQKMALMGALSLYLAFINLFLMLLRLFGRRD